MLIQNPYLCRSGKLLQRGTCTCMHVSEYMFIFCYLYTKIANFKGSNYNIKKKDVNLDHLWKVVWYTHIVSNVEYCICLNYNYIRVLMHVLTVFLFKSKIKIYRQNFSCDLIKFLFKLGMFKKKMHIGVRRNFDPGWKLNIETTDVE